jgi:hypothetical protein
MKKIMVRFDLPGVTSHVYDAVWNDLRNAGYSNPDGLLYHASTQDGNDWVVVDIWESEAQFNSFAQTLLPILGRNNVPQIQPKVSPVYFEYSAARVAEAI